MVLVNDKLARKKTNHYIMPDSKLIPQYSWIKGFVKVLSTPPRYITITRMFRCVFDDSHKPKVKTLSNVFF
jgi:hypothetical protein